MKNNEYGNIGGLLLNKIKNIQIFNHNNQKFDKKILLRTEPGSISWEKNTFSNIFNIQ